MRNACIGAWASALAALLVATGLSGGVARAQLDSREAISLQNQILELRHEMQMQSGGSEPGAPPMSGDTGAPSSTSVDQGAASPLTSQLLDRVSTLEAQVRDLRGQLDQLSNQVQQQNAALSKQIGDMNFALQQGHPGASSGGDENGPATAPVPAAPRPDNRAPERRTPEMALQQGNAALARRDYAGAQAAAREVLAGPRGPRQTDAQFLLAQSLAGQRQFQQAATAYYDVYSHAPRSGRAPDALLGVTASLLALGDKTDACQALQKLHNEFPSPQPRVRAASSSLRNRAGCR